MNNNKILDYLIYTNEKLSELNIKENDNNYIKYMLGLSMLRSIIKELEGGIDCDK